MHGLTSLAVVTPSGLVVSTTQVLSSSSSSQPLTNAIGPSTLFQYARSTKHPNSYDLVEKQSIGPARLGADMLSGALMSSARTFVCAAYYNPSDSSSVAFYTY